MDAEKEHVDPADKTIESTILSADDANLICAHTLGGKSAPPPPPLRKALGSPSPATLPTAHAPKCDCGCVPNVLSLFEMAELRKQARLKKEEAKKE